VRGMFHKADAIVLEDYVAPALPKLAGATPDSREHGHEQVRCSQSPLWVAATWHGEPTRGSHSARSGARGWLSGRAARSTRGSQVVTAESVGPAEKTRLSGRPRARGTCTLVAVHSDPRAEGRSVVLLRRIEQTLKHCGERLLLVET
jgi:hypothetical protein